MQYRTTIFIFSILLVAVIGNSSSIAKPFSDSDKAESYILKRSLCNTFGGCGSKRSLNRQMVYRDHSDTADVQDLIQTAENDFVLQTKQETQSKLIEEILDGLVDYIKSSEKYKQGKYVVIVPGRYSHKYQEPYSSTSIRAIPSDAQEVQLERLYV